MNDVKEWMISKDYNAYKMEPTGPLIFNAGFGRDMGFFLFCFFVIGPRRSSVDFFGYSGFLLSSK